MRVMAFAALDAGVLSHLGMRTLRLGVASDAGGRALPRCEGVASEAIGLVLSAGVCVHRLVLVTAIADTGAGVREAARLVPVAVLAGHRRFAHVLLMPVARAKFGPGRGHEFGRPGRRLLRHQAEKACHRTSQKKQHRGGGSDDRFLGRAHQGTPWQSRHGKSRTLSLWLVNP